MTGVVAASSVGIGVVANWGDFSGNQNASITMNASGTLTATWTGSIPSFQAVGSSSGSQSLSSSPATFSVVAGETFHFEKSGGGGGITVTIAEGPFTVDTFLT